MSQSAHDHAELTRHMALNYSKSSLTEIRDAMRKHAVLLIKDRVVRGLWPNECESHNATYHDFEAVAYHLTRILAAMDAAEKG